MSNPKNKAQSVPNHQLKKIESLYVSGDFKEAKDQIGKFRELFPQLGIYVIGPMIDVGARTDDMALIEEAVKIFKDTPKEDLDPHFFYNAGNGNQILFEHRLFSGANIFDTHNLVDDALECFNLSPSSSPSALTNQGNLYDEIGRPIEALRLYERALNIDPQFGMALGNKALAIGRLARISEYNTAYLIYSHQLYSQALKHVSSINEAANADVIRIFERDIKGIESMFAKANMSEELKRDLIHPEPKFSRLTKFVRFYTSYCLEKDLYLNLHIHSRNSDASTGDNIALHLITDNSGSYEEDKAYITDITFRLNEIKEAFIAARLALVQSQYVTNDFSNISKQTLIINNLDYSVSNIYVGYLKMAFKEGFSVLDKIAIFLNHYLELNNREDDRRLGYSSIWFKNLDRNEPFDEKIREHGATLYGLYSLFTEIRNSELDEIRNATTHRYLRVYKTMSPPEKAYEFEDLTEKTNELLFKVKCAIIYLNNFINTNEEKKKRELGEGFIPEMKLYTDQWLDLWR